MFEVRGLRKAYGGIAVVEELSFSVSAGQAVALVGGNGSGKTTTLKCVTGAEPYDAGQVLLQGRPVRETEVGLRRAMCTVLDDFAWFSEATTWEHLDLMARAHGSADPSRQAHEALTAVGLTEVADLVPLALSSGQRRRLALATTMVRHYRMLVLDEPEQRLDRSGRRWLAEHLQERLDDGVGILLASHDGALLEHLGAEVVELDMRRG
jgi:ABC-type multidrug transport system ATPase subunit